MDFDKEKGQAVDLTVAMPQQSDPLVMLEQKLHTATSDVIVAAYMKLREQKEVLDNEYRLRESDLKARMDVMERVLGVRMTNDGSKAIGTAHGTVFSQIKRHCQCGDWSAFNEWVVKENRPDLFQRRLNNSALLEIAKDTGELPPGVQVVSMMEVVVRKPTKGKS